jgi:hypothetical protein
VHSSQDSDIIIVCTTRDITVHTEKGQSVQQEGGIVFKEKIRTGHIVPVGMILEADYYVFIVVV